jgi:hypothetical protein
MNIGSHTSPPHKVLEGEVDALAMVLNSCSVSVFQNEIHSCWIVVSLHFEPFMYYCTEYDCFFLFQSESYHGPGSGQGL